MKSPQTGVIVTESSLFMVVFGDFDCSFNLKRSFVVTGSLLDPRGECRRTVISPASNEKLELTVK
jgi:hypothetical protein